jgi:hypothetical protein
LRHSEKVLFDTLNIVTLFHLLSAVLMSSVLSIAMLNVAMLSVVVLNVYKLSVVGPQPMHHQLSHHNFYFLPPQCSPHKTQVTIDKLSSCGNLKD